MKLLNQVQAGEDRGALADRAGARSTPPRGRLDLLSEPEPASLCGGRARAVRRSAGFSLAEVMVAVGIFFMAIFAILSMVSGSLKNARRLRRLQVDSGMVAAQLLIRTNRFSEGSQSGDFGEVYPDYHWEYDCFVAETNGLMQFDITVFRRGVHDPVDAMSILIFSPDSANAGFGRPRMTGP